MAIPEHCLRTCFTILSVFCLLLPPGSSANAQRSALFMEGGGVAPYYSFNYSHRLLQTTSLQGNLRIGTGVWKDHIAFPLGLSLVAGRSDHRLEFNPALGLHFEGLAFWDQARSDLLLDLVLGIAYRWQPGDSGYFLSLGVFPYLRLDPTRDQLSERAAEAGLRPGLSIGKAF